MCVTVCFSVEITLRLKNFRGSDFLVFGNNRSTFEMYEYLILTFKFKPMKKFSPAMSVIVGLFMLFRYLFGLWRRQDGSYCQTGKSRRRPRLPIGKYPARIL